MKALPFFTRILLLAVFLAGIGCSRAVYAQEAVTARITPADLTVDPAETFTLALEVLNGIGVNAFDLELTYDAALLSLDSFAPGSYLSGLAQVYKEEEPGRIRLVYTQLARPGVDGDGVLMNFTFTALAAGSAPVQITSLELADSQGNLGYPDLQSALITIRQVSVPTETVVPTTRPTQTFTHTPTPTATLTPQPTATHTAPPTATRTPTQVYTQTPTRTPTATHTAVGTLNPSQTPSRTPTATRTAAATLVDPTQTAVTAETIAPDHAETDMPESGMQPDQETPPQTEPTLSGTAFPIPVGGLLMTPAALALADDTAASHDAAEMQNASAQTRQESAQTQAALMEVLLWALLTFLFGMFLIMLLVLVGRRKQIQQTEEIQ